MMKKYLFLFVSLLLLVGCVKSDDEKAEQLVKEWLMNNINDPSSLEIISIEPIKTDSVLNYRDDINYKMKERDIVSAIHYATKSYDEGFSELAKKYGEIGTPERTVFDEEAYSFYTAQLLLDARKEAGMTQAELAKKVHSTKSYISRLEHGEITPSVGLFFQIISALGFEVMFRKQSSPFVY